MQIHPSDINDISSDYLSDSLSPRQLKRLNRKCKKHNQQQHKTTDINNVVNIRPEPQRVKLAAKNAKQQELINSMTKYEQVIVRGPAGTGKTFVTVSYACEQFLERKIKKIIIARPNVGVGKTLGLLPGTLEEKYSAWLAETIAIMKMKLGDSLYELALKRGDIEMVPFEMIRGRSFSNSFILVTEAQNLSIEEATSLVTRVGEDSKLIIDGDIRQSDLSKDNGLSWMLKMIDNNSTLESMCGNVEFGINDVVRSKICKAWVTAIWHE